MPNEPASAGITAKGRGGRRHVRITSSGWLHGEVLPVCQEYGNGAVRVEILHTRGVYFKGETALVMAGDFIEEDKESMSIETISIESRVDEARRAVEEHASATGNEADDYAAQLADLLANLMHFAQAEGLDFTGAISTARMHFEDEGGDGLACFDSADAGVTVRMSSDVYGAEDYSYGSVAEALAGMRRLARQVREQGDGVAREIVMLCPFDGSEDAS